MKLIEAFIIAQQEYGICQEPYPLRDGLTNGVASARLP